MKKHTGIGILIFLSFILVPKLSFSEQIILNNPGNSNCGAVYKLSYGDKDVDFNNEISILQNFLKNNGYFKDIIDGKFGRKTLMSVEAFQKTNFLKADGIVGKNTLTKIPDFNCINKNNRDNSINSSVKNSSFDISLNNNLSILSPNNQTTVNQNLSTPNTSSNSVISNEQKEIPVSNPGNIISSKTINQNNSKSVSFVCPNNTSNIADVRDMWVWKDNTELVTSGNQTQKDFFNFVDSHHIRNVYLSLNVTFFNDATNVANLKTFLNTAQKEHCLGVEALSGDPSWIVLPNNKYFTSGKTTNRAVEWANVIKNFNASVSNGDAKFIGLQYDVEPHGLNLASGYVPYWAENDNSYSATTSDQILENAFIDMLQEVKATLVNSGLIFDVAIPRWLDTKDTLTSFVRTDGTTGKSVAEYVIDNTDAVTIMDYTTEASSIYNDAKNELDYVANVGKKARLGVEVGDDNSNPQANFYNQSCSQMNGILTSAYNLMTSVEQKSFDGFSIHYYKHGNNIPGSYSLMCP